MMFSGIAIKNVGAFKHIAVIALAVLLGVNICETYGYLSLGIDTRGMLEFTKFGMYFNSLILFATLAYVFLSGRDMEYVHENGRNTADYYALIFFILVGVGVITSFNNLLMLFLGIEIISIPLYVLTGTDKKNLKSNEGSLKYLLMGAFSTGIMLMGITLLYGATGSFGLNAQPIINGFGPDTARLTQLGLVLLFISMAFKVSAAPFHFWTPDVYDGAPSVFTSFMSTIVKAAVFIGFVKIFEQRAVLIKDNWHLFVSVIIVATLFVGNITAVFQQSVKRMLAYSSIAQAGFMLFALYSLNATAKEGLLLYGIAYSLATIGIFAILIKMKDYTFEGYNGLAKKQPVLAAANVVFLLSLAGIPATAGFFAKFYMLQSVVQTGQGLWLVVVGVVFAAISVYYYFKVIQAMYFKQGDAELATPVSLPYKIGLIVLAITIIIIGVKPDIIFNWLYF